MRAAGQDWYEQGDIWAQLAAHRTTDTDYEPSPATLAAVQRLLAAAGDAGDSPLASARRARRAPRPVARHDHQRRQLRPTLPSPSFQ
ncbi:MAG: hypothetical protein ACRDSZ_06270 [Pseudonocardiaceae bacterium]